MTTEKYKLHKSYLKQRLKTKYISKDDLDNAVHCANRTAEWLVDEYFFRSRYGSEICTRFLERYYTAFFEINYYLDYLKFNGKYPTMDLKQELKINVLRFIEEHGIMDLNEFDCDPNLITLLKLQVLK